MREAAGGAPSAGEAGDPHFPSMRESDLRELTWSRCGLARSAEGLTEAVRILESAGMRPLDAPKRAGYELRNLHAVALLIAKCALARRESRGGHYRIDYPEKSAEFQKHSSITKDEQVTFY